MLAFGASSRVIPRRQLSTPRLTEDLCTEVTSRIVTGELAMAVIAKLLAATRDVRVVRALPVRSVITLVQSAK